MHRMEVRQPRRMVQERSDDLCDQLLVQRADSLGELLGQARCGKGQTARSTDRASCCAERSNAGGVSRRVAARPFAPADTKQVRSSACYTPEPSLDNGGRSTTKNRGCSGS
jgi:hypothetical protein